MNHAKSVQINPKWILVKSPFLDMTSYYYDPSSGFMYSITNNRITPAANTIQVIEHHNSISTVKIPLPKFVKTYDPNEYK